MKYIIIILLALMLSSCAKVTVKKDGDYWDVSYLTFLRKVENVKAGVGDVDFSLGKAGVDSPIPPEAIACMIAPTLCQ